MDSWDEFRREIARRLNLVRPPRVGASEHEWREPVYGWARNHLPDESSAVKNLARQEVDNAANRATRAGNKYLRDWAKGQAPLFWSDLGPFPIKVGKLHIRFDAATPDDMEDGAREQEVRGKQTYDEMVLLTRTLRDLARDARRQGLPTVAMLGDLAPLDIDDDIDDDDEDETA